MTFTGVYLIFMPMHWLGLLTQSRLLPDAQRVALASAGASIRTLVTVATISTVFAQVLFLINFVEALARRKASQEEDNPWRATTLEWSVASPVPQSNFGNARPTVYRGAYEFPEGLVNDFAPQHLAPELLAQKVR
jgi:cytochrome c oxidase subunit 1